MATHLVIGAEGFVGRSFCNYLENKGERVMSFDIKHAPSEDGRTATLDLSQVDYVYFLAWDVGGAKYLYNADNQLHQLEWNLNLLTNLMPQLAAHGKPFLFVSSQLAEVCDTVYGVTKRLGEVWAGLVGGVRIRLWNVYGPVENVSQRSHVMSDMVIQAVKTGHIQLMTTGDEKRQFIHMDDVCDAFHQAVLQNVRGVYDVTSFNWVTIREIANLIAELAGADVIIGSKIGSTPITPIRGPIPGWSAKVSLEEGISRMIRIARQLP